MGLKIEVLKITQNDSIYPRQLFELKNPPKVLYAIGNIEILKEDLFSVVGSRGITEYGIKYGEKICRELVLRDIPLVSRISYRNR